MYILLSQCQPEDVVLVNDCPLIVWSVEGNEVILAGVQGKSAGTYSKNPNTRATLIWRKPDGGLTSALRQEGIELANKATTYALNERNYPTKPSDDLCQERR